MDYNAQTNKIAKKLGLTLKVISQKFGKYFPSDTDSRFIFKMKLQRGKKSYTFNYGQSIEMGSNHPTMYDILSCLQKYEVGTFEDFCGDFGYDTDSRTAEKTYKAVCKEYEAMTRLFNQEELEKLQEFQ